MPASASAPVTDTELLSWPDRIQASDAQLHYLVPADLDLDSAAFFAEFAEQRRPLELARAATVQICAQLPTAATHRPSHWVADDCEVWSDPLTGIEVGGEAEYLLIEQHALNIRAALREADTLQRRAESQAAAAFFARVCQLELGQVYSIRTHSGDARKYRLDSVTPVLGRRERMPHGAPFFVFEGTVLAAGRKPEQPGYLVEVHSVAQACLELGGLGLKQSLKHPLSLTACEVREELSRARAAGHPFFDSIPSRHHGMLDHLTAVSASPSQLPFACALAQLDADIPLQLFIERGWEGWLTLRWEVRMDAPGGVRAMAELQRLHPDVDRPWTGVLLSLQVPALLQLPPRGDVQATFDVAERVRRSRLHDLLALACAQEFNECAAAVLRFHPRARSSMGLVAQWDEQISPGSARLLRHTLERELAADDWCEQFLARP